MFGIGLTFEDNRPLLPATPVVFPRFEPRVDNDSDDADPQADPGPTRPLVDLLQGIVRPTEISPAHFAALGVDVHPDSGPEDLLPDPSYFPDFAAWDGLTPDEARAKNQETRRPLCNGGQSPGCQIYLDRVRELSTLNEDAFRTVRRIPPPKGQQQARLGNSYEFFRCLEGFTPFWDDTTAPPKKRPPRSDGPPPEGYRDAASSSLAASSPGPPGQQQPPPTIPAPVRSDPRSPPPTNYWQTGIGAAMTGSARLNLLSAFLKLVAYDFGCNVSAARTEPRLQLVSQPGRKGGSPKSSYFASNCTFVFRSPTTREAARAGIVEGPIAAVSARATIDFDKPEDELIDLARELVAALLTAQHRARQGKEEARVGEGKWWTTAKRWGGGPGGPIGREMDVNDIPGDKDEAPPGRGGGGPAAEAEGSPSVGLMPSSSPLSSSSSGSPMVLPAKKRARKNMGMYDNYRMVRPPSLSWDKKARYEAIGRRRGADFDDIFVVSSLFHHVSLVRARVPLRLLEVLEGAPGDGEEDAGGDGAEANGERRGRKGRSWGRLAVWRSRWFDFYKTEDRIAAAQVVWGMMAYMMRKEDGDGDVKMADA